MKTGEILAIRVLLLVSLVCVFVAVLTAAFDQGATKYESSIYSEYPIHFWLSILIAVGLGIGVVLFGFFSRLKPYQYAPGFAPIIIANSLLLALPHIRGYPIFGRGDVLTHIGWVKDILQNGNVGATDIYPIDHIMTAILSSLSSIDVNSLSMMVPVWFSLLFTPFFFVLARVIFSSTPQALIATVLASILIFGNLHMAFAPYNQSFLMLPFVLFLVVSRLKSEAKRSISLLVIVTMLFAVFLHPLIVLVIVAALLAIDYSSGHSNHDRGTSPGMTFTTHGPYRLAAIALAVFFVWQSYAYLLISSVRKIYLVLTGSTLASEFGRYSDLVQAVQPRFLDLLRLVLDSYGQMLVLGTLSISISIYLLLRMAKSRRRLQFGEQMPMLAFYVFSGIAAGIFFMLYIVGFARAFYVAMLFSFLLAGSWVGILLKSRTSRRQTIVRGTLLAVLVIPLLYFSTFNLYLSPTVMYPNQQVTAAEIMGMESFFQTRDVDRGILELGLSQERFYESIYGSDAPALGLRYGRDTQPLDHFGYNESLELGVRYQSSKYLVINDLGRNYYQYLYPHYEQRWRFTEIDHQRLSDDNSVQLVSDNGDLRVYLTTTS